jgi:hypothetical protein
MRFVFLAAVLFALTVSRLLGGQPREPLVDQVKASINRGVNYLKSKQRPEGHWEHDLQLGTQYRGGQTSLAILALLYSGVPPQDKTVARGLDYLRSFKPDKTYVRALQTMAFAEARQTEDRERITENVKWLLDARIRRDGQFLGWSYHLSNPGSRGDNSNTQYAMLGLHAGSQAGAVVPREAWLEIRDFYIRTQHRNPAVPTNDGYFSYAPGDSRPSLTMTVAGACGLIISGAELNKGRERILADGTAENCGSYEENQPIARALRWISADRLQLNLGEKTYYNLYGFERLGRLTGLRFIGGHDWYREGCEFLVNRQRQDGSWEDRGAYDMWPIVNTSFALLFLSKGRTPILISKLVHTPNGQRGRDDLDWNPDRNDIRNLTDFASRELFHKLPLAWQIFDMTRSAGSAPSEEDLLKTTSEMLQSPIVYITGHSSPRLRFNAIEKKLLKQYVDNGGFIMAEACCGSPDFDQGFKELCLELWPENPLEYLPGDHAVWNAAGNMPVPPGRPHKLMGIQMGCKRTVVVYSPQDLSCLWESNEHDGRARIAFRLGANIIAYATGLEPPRPRLTQVEVASNREETGLPRGYFEVAQIKYNGDYKPAVHAMRNLMDHMRKLTRIDVVLKTKEIAIFKDAPEESIKDYKFLYLHGREKFEFGKEELDHVRFNLQNGGLLFSDACCGNETFDAAFRKFAADLFPKNKLERIPLNDVLFSKELNQEPLTSANIRCRQEKGGPIRNVAPWLEGIKINGRWAVIYSKYDVGCALERHQAPDCIGYTTDSAFRLAAAAVLYTLHLPGPGTVP